MARRNIAAASGFQVTLSKTLIEQLEILALTGMYGTDLTSVIEHIASNELRNLMASGQFASLRNLKSYPAAGGDDESKKESKD
jgi:hypothetical protein